MNTSVAIPIATAILATVVVLVAYFLLKRQVARERAAIRSEADRVLAEATKASEARQVMDVCAVAFGPDVVGLSEDFDLRDASPLLHAIALVRAPFEG